MTQERSPLFTFMQQVVELAQKFDAVLKEALRPGTEFRAFIDALPTALPKLEKKIKELPDKARAAFRDAGFPPSNRLSLSDIDEVIEAHETGGASAAASVLESKYRELVNDDGARLQMLNDWAANPLLGNRIAIARAAVEAAIRGKYVLAIPALLAQLEGLIADAFAHIGQMGGAKYKGYVQQLAGKDHLLGVQLEEFVHNVVLVNFEHGMPMSSELSRHAILHGGDTSYGTERNALRLITLFDYVQEHA